MRLLLDPLMVVGTADRNLVVFNLQKPQTEFKRVVSPLKYQTRCLAAFPDQQGFLLSSLLKLGKCHLKDEDDDDDLMFVDKHDALQMPTNKNNKGKQVVKKRLIKGYESLNSSLKALYCYSESAMANGEGIFICDIYIHMEDIIPFCDLEPISGNCIVVYIWHLYKQMKEASTLSGFRFVNPFSVSYVGKKAMNVRAQILAERLESVCSGQLVLVPCNVGLHWILTVIDPHKEIIYLLDPLYNRNRDESWKNIVNMAINVFNAMLGKKGKKQPSWENITALRQPDSKQCGFYVMRFMKQIIEGLNKNYSNSIRSLFKKEKY